MGNYRRYKAYPLLGLLILLTACKGQEKPPPLISTPLTSEVSKTIIQSILSRVDTVLNFRSRVGIIFQDSKSNYWFSSQEEGLCRYDGQLFTYFENMPPVRAIQEDHSGNIRLGLEDAVGIFDGKTLQQIFPQIRSIVFTEYFSRSGKDSGKKREVAQEPFWFSAFNKNGVYHFDGEELVHLTLPVPKGYPDFGETGYHPDYGYDPYAVYSIYQDQEANMWMGTSGAGVFQYNGKYLRCINESAEKGTVRAILQDRNGKIWFGNNAKGLYQYDGNSLLNLSKAWGLKELGLMGALGMVEDEEGRLWVGTYDSGVFRYDPSSSESEGRHAWVRFSTEEGLDTNYISCVYIDKEGKVWMGTGKGSVYHNSGSTFVKLSK